MVVTQAAAQCSQHGLLQSCSCSADTDNSGRLSDIHGKQAVWAHICGHGVDVRVCHSNVAGVSLGQTLVVNLGAVQLVTGKDTREKTCCTVSPAGEWWRNRCQEQADMGESCCCTVLASSEDVESSAGRTALLTLRAAVLP